MHYGKKIFGLWIIKIVAFLLVFVMLFHGATDLFRTKTDYSSLGPIYNLPKNSVDVLLLGTSHMNDTISPMDLWGDYGITSFNAAIGGQSIPTTYFELRELLRVQKPKVVVLETHYVYQKDMIVDSESRLHWLVDNVPFSFGICEAIQTLIQEDHDKTEYYLNFFSFHNRWRELSKNDFKPVLGYNRGAYTGGYAKHSTIESPSIVLRTETKTPPELPLEYLYKIIELCRDNEIQLVFIVQPFKTSNDIQKMMNYVDVIANQEGIPYINYFYLLDEVGFDFAMDLADYGHLNYSGMKKLTSHLGQYLQTNYNLQDHRNDHPIADLWDKDYETYIRVVNNIMMKTAQTADEYFDYLRNKDYIIAWNAYSETSLSGTALPELLKNMGIEQNEMPEGPRYYAVARGDQLLYGRASDEKSNDSYMTEDTLFSFGRGIAKSSNNIGVHVGRTEYSVGNKGMNLAVYDPVTRTVVDSVNIDLETGEITRK